MLNNARFKLLFIVFTFCAVSIAEAQKFYFEPQIGSAATEYRGNNLIADSIRVVTGGNDYAGLREIRSIGLNVGYKISTRLDALLAISFFKLDPSYVVYNEKTTCTFCPIEKGGSQFFRDIQLSVRPRFALITTKKIKIIVFAESSIHFTINKFNEYTPIDDFNGTLPMVANVLNSLAAAPGKTFFSFGYGWAFYYKKISLTVRYTENISNTITRNLEVEDASFPFINDFKRLNFTLGYQFYFKKKEDKNLD